MTVQTTTLTAIESAGVTTLSNRALFIAVGTGTSTASSTQTTLDVEVLRETVFNTIAATSSYTVSMYLDVTEANGNIIGEIGTFNSSSSGTMVSRNLTTTQSKTSSKEFYYDLAFNLTATNN